VSYTLPLTISLLSCITTSQVAEAVALQKRCADVAAALADWSDKMFPNELAAAVAEAEGLGYGDAAVSSTIKEN